MNKSQTRRDFVLLLFAYLAGDASMDDFINWETGLSLDPSAAGRLRGSLDRLALIAEEVADGLRVEREFRALALKTLLRETPLAPAVTTRTAAETEPISRRISNRPASAINLEITFAGR